MATVKQPVNTFHYPITIRLPDLKESFTAAYKIAKRSNRRLPSLSEFIRTLDHDPEFLKESQGHRYWLRDKTRIEHTGFCRIDYEKGEIIPVSRAEHSALPARLRAYSYKGKGPMRLSVGPDGSIVVTAEHSVGMPASVALVEDETARMLEKTRDALARLKRGLSE